MVKNVVEQCRLNLHSWHRVRLAERGDMYITETHGLSTDQNIAIGEKLRINFPVHDIMVREIGKAQFSSVIVDEFLLHLQRIGKIFAGSTDHGQRQNRQLLHIKGHFAYHPIRTELSEDMTKTGVSVQALGWREKFFGEIFGHGQKYRRAGRQSAAELLIIGAWLIKKYIKGYGFGR